MASISVAAQPLVVSTLPNISINSSDTSKFSEYEKYRSDIPRNSKPFIHLAYNSITAIPEAFIIFGCIILIFGFATAAVQYSNYYLLIGSAASIVLGVFSMYVVLPLYAKYKGIRGDNTKVDDLFKIYKEHNVSTFTLDDLIKK